jgi:gliding motility-associated protein GldL
MAAKKGGFSHFFYSKVAPIATGLGASVVIVGALFKIMHWPGAGPMLIVGLGTEAVLFAMFAFAPQAHEWDWSKVYPQLKEDEDEEVEVTESTPSSINNELVDKLGKGMAALTSSVDKISEVGRATIATAEYAKNVKVASQSLQEMNKSYSHMATSMSDMAKSTNDIKAYSSQLQAVTASLASLNGVYQGELREVQNYSKELSKFYGTLSKAMENMTEAAKDAQQFRSEMAKLNGNLTALNNVYGGMITAMKSGLK